MSPRYARQWSIFYKASGKNINFLFYRATQLNGGVCNGYKKISGITDNNLTAINVMCHLLVR
jgi:hypothetical protein